MVEQLPVTRPDRKTWRNAYRIINSAFPPLSVFEDVLDPADLETAYTIEAMTNDRLREEAGELWRVPWAERVSGPGSTPVMAAFTHIGMATRFSDGTYGVYYCASSLQAAIAETSYHRAEFLAATREDSLELTMRVYINRIVKPLHDIRAGFDALHDPDTRTYPQAQAFGREVRAGGSWGLLYRSVRAPGHECAAIFRPRAVSLPLQGPHLRYVWDGKAQAFTHVLEISEL